MKQSLKRYRERLCFLASKEVMEQEDIDSVTRINDVARSNPTSNSHLPKGIDSITLNDIRQLLKSNRQNGITAVELGKQVGTSRSTARRYLEYLVSIKEARPTLKYGNVGRPERQYVLREFYEQNKQYDE
ncbi:HTH domain-containing protein [Virgibacillus sp. FSP13]